VYLVLGGRGRVEASVAGEARRKVDVDAYRLYTVRSGRQRDGMLTLRVSPGVAAYAFTFG
jgi:hypothetical protein